MVSTPSKPPKLSKRINNRLQLAAALVEADNDLILERAEQLAESLPKRHDPNDPRPAPPPEPKLASQSAIFAPYREGAAPVAVATHARAGSAASRLSNLSGTAHGRRSSIDFLGVQTPTEKKFANSSSSFGRASPFDPGRTFATSGDRPSSSLGANGSNNAGTTMNIDDDDADDDDGEVLGDWGVEKFLSQEERDRIARRRSRADSIGTSAGPLQPPERSTSAMGYLSAGLGAGAAPTLAQSTSGSLQNARAKSDIVEGSLTENPNLSLLAKIKLYRERQDNLPPDQWHVTGLKATDLQADDRTSGNVEAPSLASPSGGSVLNRPFPRVIPDLAISESGSQLLEGISPAGRPGRSNQSSRMSYFDDTPATISGASSTAALSPMLGAMMPPTLDPTANPPPITVISNGHQVMKSDDTTFQRRVSTMGITGTSWSDQEDDDSEDDRPLSMYVNGLNLLKQFENKEPAALSTLPEVMAGIGSFSNANSRRNSLLGPREASMGELRDGVISPKPWATAEISSGMSSPVLVRSRPGTPGHISPAPLDSTTILGPGPSLAQDLYGDFDFGPSPFPQSPGLRKLELEPSDPNMLEPNAKRQSMPMDGLTTRQLQALARNGGVPQYHGELPASSAVSVISDQASYIDAKNTRAKKEEKERAKRAKELQREIQKQLEKAEKESQKAREKLERKERSAAKKVSTLSPEFKFPPLLDEKGEPLQVAAQGAVAEADLSSTRWAKKRRSVLMSSLVQPFVDVQDGREGDDSTKPHKKGASAVPVFPPLPLADRFGEVDDSDTSPPSKGPLKPRGLAAWLPKILVMPQFLENSPNEPRTRLTDTATGELLSDKLKRISNIYVPDGFVLHDRHGLPPSKKLQVLGARGPLPYFKPPKAEKKHDAAVSEFLQSAGAARTLAVPVTAPAGIGRRAAAPTTALFRNQLVTHGEDRDGWGWETTSFYKKAESVSSDEDDDEPLEQLKQKGFLARTAARRARRAKRARKKARRERRAKRETAHLKGTDYAAVGVDEISPDEDLDLSDTTSEESSDGTESDESWNSTDEKRWVDDQKPVGKLFGMSLMDVAEERKQTQKAKTMYYGQQSLEQEAQAEAALGPVGDGASMAPSVAAKSFREAPLGTNDTRERMELAFGTDQIWAREMAQRREEEAKEAAEREAQELADEKRRKEKEELKARKLGKKSRGKGNGDIANDDTPKAGPSSLPGADDEPARPRTPIDPPTIDLEFGEGLTKDSEPKPQRPSRRNRNKDPSEEGAQWFTRSSDEEGEEDSDTDSEEENARRNEATRQARLLRSPGGNKTLKSLPAEQSDSSEDEVPLAQLRNKIQPRVPSFAAGLNGGIKSAVEVDSSDEEVPLADILGKWRQANRKMGALNLDFMQAGTGLIPALPFPPAVATAEAPLEDEDSDEDRPLGIAHPNGAVALAAVKLDAGSDDEDDQPLGAAHPQAAIIAEQAALIKYLQEQQEQQSRMSMMGSGFGGMGWMHGGGVPGGGYGGMHAGMAGVGQQLMAPSGFAPPGSVFNGNLNDTGGWGGAPLQQSLHPSASMSMFIPPPPGSVIGGAQFAGAGPALSPSLSMPAMMGGQVPGMMSASPAFQTAKVTSIDRWRSEVPNAPVESKAE